MTAEVKDGVDVVIVHYNTPIQLRKCLVSLCDKCPDRFQQIVVVDNASPDRRVEQIANEFPLVRFRFNSKNLGFATASNEGIMATESPYCLLLNPDTTMTCDAVEAMMTGMVDHADAGIVAPRMQNLDGSLQMSCRRYPTLMAVLLRATHFLGGNLRPVDDYLMREWDHAQLREVDWVIGACMLLRRVAVEEIGLLDDAFFMYYEDTDLCRRLSNAGWRVYYEPKANVTHEHRRESANFLPGRATRAHARSLVRLFCKHRFVLW